MNDVEQKGNSGAAAGETSDESVRRRTGKGWEEWFQILDDAGAEEMTHPEIARYLEQRLKVSGWWAQQITGTYERARGRRIRHEMPEGFQISKSKTYSVPVARLYSAWMDSAARVKWLSTPKLEVSKSTPEKSIRIRWEGGKSSVEVSFAPKGETKSQVTIQHNRLADAAEAERMKAFWGEALLRLVDYLAGTG